MLGQSLKQKDQKEKTNEKERGKTTFFMLSLESVATDAILPHRSRSIEARRSGSSAFHRAASDWTRSRLGPPVPGRTLSTRSRWDATGRHGNLRAQHKQPEPLWKPPAGTECSAGGWRETRSCIRSPATQCLPVFVLYSIIQIRCFCLKCVALFSLSQKKSSLL